jgi:peroxiredoxin Q/BCP
VEGREFRDQAAAFAKKNVEILGISFDSVEKNRKFAEKFDFPYRLLCDTTREIGVAYHAADGTDARTPKRISYLIDPQGKIARAWAKVTPAAHPAEVLAAVG